MSKKRIALGAVIVLILAGIVLGAQQILPMRQTPTPAYFAQREAAHLTPDESRDLRVLQDFLNQGVADFTGYESFPAGMWKYGLAFTAYGLTAMTYIEPGQRAAVSSYLDKLILKMKQKVIWEDWIKNGYGDDPVAEHNIMYKGHLNLMYGLYALVSSDRKWEADFTWLTNNISAEIDASPYCGVTCEPDDYFVQCNSIGIYSLLMYDRLYGTDHSKQMKSWLNWVKANLIVQPYGVLSKVYHPSKNEVDPEVSGYGNGWTLAFVHAFDPAFSESLYPAYKQAFIQEQFGFYAFASEKPGGKPDLMATVFALLAAKEMGDQPLFDKLMNAVEKQAPPTVDGNRVSYKGVDKAGLGLVFFGKINVGLARFLRDEPRD